MQFPSRSDWSLEVAKHTPARSDAPHAPVFSVLSWHADRRQQSAWRPHAGNEMAELVRNTWQGARHGLANRALPIGNHPFDRDRERLAHTRCFLQERNEILLCCSEQTPCYQHFS